MELDELAKVAIDNAQKCYLLLKETGLDKSALKICKDFTSWFSSLFKGHSKEKIKYLSESEMTEKVHNKIIQLQGVLEELLFENKELQDKLQDKIKELESHKDIERYSISIIGDYNNVLKNISKSKINITYK